MLENKEVWRDCKGYEDRYQVSNMGRIWSIVSQRYLLGSPDKDGYLKVNLTAKNGKKKTERIHRLVALAWLPNPSGLPVVNHKDENKQNNNIDNLEWCDVSYNNIYSKGKAVRCVETGKVYDSSQTAMRETGIDGSDIRKCCKGQLRTAGKMHWEYV